ncbi:transposase [Elysia marginata]|uniref:Transposase n=1 Tax=Elysia marginata TaxID=1093978 RepID=A0AAV4EUM6_9GAST|nr:transposase [Elysia marginata]
MPRVYVRKNENYGKTPADVMQRAIDDLKINGKKVREAARDHGIPRGTLRNNLKKVEEGKTILVPNYHHARIFSDEQEDVLAHYAVNCAKMFHGLTTKALRTLAYDLAKANNMKFPSNWDTEKLAGKEWYRGFIRRNPQISIRQPEATSLARATAFNPYTVGVYFDNLECAFRKTGASGAQIFNLDETGLTIVHKVSKVLAPKGLKRMGQVTSAERGELVTLCAIVSAVGQALPPVFIFRRMNFSDLLMTGAPEGSLGLANKSGWMTSENFVYVIDHLVKHVRPSSSYPIILTMDNHESHISYMALEKAKENNITIVTLPPHTSNKTQP